MSSSSTSPLTSKSQRIRRTRSKSRSGSDADKLSSKSPPKNELRKRSKSKSRPSSGTIDKANGRRKSVGRRDPATPAEIAAAASLTLRPTNNRFNGTLSTSSILTSSRPVGSRVARPTTSQTIRPNRTAAAFNKAARVEKLPESPLDHQELVTDPSTPTNRRRSLRTKLRVTSNGWEAVEEKPHRLSASRRKRTTSVSSGSGPLPQTQILSSKSPAVMNAKQVEMEARSNLTPLNDYTEHPLELTRENFKEKIEVLKPLGCGSYGVVMLVRHIPTNRLLAMKKMSKARIIERSHVDRVINEKLLLFHSKHPFIVDAIDTFNDKNYVYLFLEFVNGGELFTRVRLKPLGVNDARFYTAEVALALNHLHSLGIVYRDLKPENVVIDHDGHVRLVDFGFAKQIVDRSWTLCGTPEYMSPEAIRNCGAGRPADWWALGCFLYELLAAISPFEPPIALSPRRETGDEAMQELISSNSLSGNKMTENILFCRIKFPSHFSKDARDVISGLLHPDPTERLGFDALQTHPFFASIDWSALERKEVEAPWKPTLESDTDARHFNVPREDLLRFLKTMPGPRKNDPFDGF